MDEKQNYLVRSETTSTLESDPNVVGSTDLIDENGDIRLIPVSNNSV